MRFLLSLILSFLIVAPFESNAKEIPGKQLETDIHKSSSTTNHAEYAFSDDYDADKIIANHRNSPTTRFRPFHFSNFINTVAFQNQINFSYKEKLFVQQHLYCKSIGLKLVFPEHYFW